MQDTIESVFLSIITLEKCPRKQHTLQRSPKFSMLPAKSHILLHTNGSLRDLSIMTLTTSVTWQGVTEKGVVARTILRKLSFPNSRATLLTFRTTTLALSARRQDNQDLLKEQFYSD